MRLLVVSVMAFLLAGCTTVEQDATHFQQEQDAISAAAKKIKVVHGSTVKGHPQYTELGKTQGFCFNRPNSTGGELVHGDGLRMAAYRKYGDQVDAIVNTSVWFVSDDDYGAFEPYTEGGYFECAGTAVHFIGGSSSPSVPSPDATPAQAPHA